MDPHSFSKLDPFPDPHSFKKPDPDPHEVDADLKHWPKQDEKYTDKDRKRSDRESAMDRERRIEKEHYIDKDKGQYKDKDRERAIYR
jgi:hypothetical protein